MIRPTLALAAVLLVTPAMAQAPPGPTPQCTPTYQAMEATLLLRFNEVSIGIGWVEVPAPGGANFFLSKAGTWTFVTTDAHGVTCIRMGGVAWERLGPKLPVPGQRPAAFR